jgi:hypothetical protein
MTSRFLSASQVAIIVGQLFHDSASTLSGGASPVGTWRRSDEAAAQCDTILDVDPVDAVNQFDPGEISEWRAELSWELGGGYHPGIIRHHFGIIECASVSGSASAPTHRRVAGEPRVGVTAEPSRNGCVRIRYVMGEAVGH